MFCPDCGSETGDAGQFCPACGYPIADLIERLDREEKEAMGWAEKIVGKSNFDLKPPSEPPLATFSPEPEPLPEDRESVEHRKCYACGSEVGYASLCPHCGDKLPGILDADPFLPLVFNGLWKIFIAPAHFAQSFPYPVRGGTTQPLLYPGIFAGLLILSIPFSRAELWLGRIGTTVPMIAAIVGFILSIVLSPVLIWLSAGLINMVSRVLGGQVRMNRTIRVFGAVVIFVTIIGIVVNFIDFAIYKWPSDNLSFQIFLDRLATRRELVQAVILGIGAWLFSWIFGGLARFPWWKAVIMCFASYWILVLGWLYLLVVLPLHAGGLL